MAAARKDGEDSRGSLSVHPAAGVSPEVSTHESDPGDGGGGDGPASANGTDVLRKGDVLGRYLVLEQLGAGAMGVVYAAYDPELDRKIAIKILRPHEGKGDRTRRRERLVREAKAMAKLSHPNVGAIYDVGVHGDQVFLAMEFLSGGTLSAWMKAKKRPWREIVKMFIEVGKGLAGAHAEGLIHRDFKPDNVLIDKNGVPKVVDFGLVRLTGGALDRSTTGTMDAVSDEDDAASLPVAETALAALTRTGAIAGTPAYMAPEQFLGKDIDARTDQFAFCVALYEALYGERPFAGATVISVADAVTSEKIRPLPKNNDIPTWVRRCLIRGLRADPAQRYPGFDDLLDALANDPVARLRRRVFVAAGSAIAIAIAIAAYQTIVSKRREIEKQVAEHVGVADAALAEADTKRTESRSLRERSFAAFDNYQRDKGEGLWAQSLADAKVADASYLRGIQQLEAAITLTHRHDLKDRIADALLAYIQMDGRTPGERDIGLHRLASYDDGGRHARQVNLPAVFKIDTIPSGLRAKIDTYERSSHRAFPASVQTVGPTPIELELAPGSYRFSFDGDSTHPSFCFPVVFAPGERLSVTVPAIARSALPKGFVYVPAGRFLFGSDNEELRASFLEATPIHPVKLDAFIISQYETTFAQWIEFLEDLPAGIRSQRMPHGAADGSGGFLALRQLADGHWELSIRPTTKLYSAIDGQPIVYKDRELRSTQNWLRFPVAGVSAEDAVAYAGWLDRTKRVRGARLCTEQEWEKAARGADEREFPHGDKLLPDDANFDLTYGRRDNAYGPDEVGAHVASISPFNLYDMVGNVWEITTSSLERGQLVGRGGSFYQFRPAQHATNRYSMASVTRDHTVGIRICSSIVN